VSVRTIADLPSRVSPSAWRDPIGALTRETLEAADMLVTHEFWVPALTLVYSAIDNMSWLSVADSLEVRGSDFQGWCTRYLIPKITMPRSISAVEFYAARCAILHTRVAGVLRDAPIPGSPQRGISVRDARELCYTADGVVISSLRWRSSNEAGRVSVPISDLLDAFEQAALEFRDSVLADTLERERIANRALMWLSPARPGEVLQPRTTFPAPRTTRVLPVTSSGNSGCNEDSEGP
jgi:hypothetical protein